MIILKILLIIVFIVAISQLAPFNRYYQCKSCGAMWVVNEVDNDCYKHKCRGKGKRISKKKYNM